jgi:hypothetical protein
MSNDIAQQNLREPEQVDWDNLGKSSYVAPPPALGPDGKAIVYFGQVSEVKKTDPDQGYLNFQIDFKVVKSNIADGLRVRTWLSARPFMSKDAEGNLMPLKGNPNKLAQFLRSAGLQAKPQTNSEYEASVKAASTKTVPFTIDWEAKNKDTGETVRGYNSFPDDPERPGQKRSILKAGDVYNEIDSKGNIIGTKTVQSEILFANVRLKYFQDPTPKVTR